jgi:HD-GYP domain-containing protein (c-di-GMP phosphodiesterase class II)
MTENEALDEIRINAGKQFDPEIAEQFIKLMTSPDAVS